MYSEIQKVLSPNDLGLTGAHQGGILIPKAMLDLQLFPNLDQDIPNPRCKMSFIDLNTRTNVELTFIYYNGKALGFSSRSEYRLTGLTRYLRSWAAAPGDTLVLSRNNEVYEIDVRKKSDNNTSQKEDGTMVVRLSGTWTSIKRGK